MMSTIDKIQPKETPRAGFEPATNRLTVDRSTAELPRNIDEFSSLKYLMTSKKINYIEILMVLAS